MLINILKLNEFIILMIHIFEFDYRLLFIFIGLIRKFKLLLKIYNLFCPNYYLKNGLS